MKTVSVLLAVLASGVPVNAAIISFDLAGRAAPGLHPANEIPFATSVGSGGEIGSGITFDNVSLVLTINVGWGTANGFTNLTGPATDAHIHLIPAAPAGDRFVQNGSVTIGFPGNPNFVFNTSASGGSITGSQTLTADQVTALNEQRLYVNVHTNVNGGGELRGNIVPVPEPSAFGLIALGAFTGLASRRRRTGPASS